MLNEAFYEPDWAAQAPAPERPYMESNRWLTSVCATRASRRTPMPEAETFDLLGVKLVWTKDRGRPFPSPVLEAIKTLLQFAELQPNWDSYSGHPLQAAAGQAVIQIVIRAHHFARMPRLYPLGDGGVGLTWEGDADLEIMVAGDGTVEALLTTGESEVELAPGSALTSGMELLERYLTNR